MYSVQVLLAVFSRRDRVSALTPFYPEPEPKDFFRHMKLKELITSRSSLQKKMLKEVFQTGEKMMPDGNMDGHKEKESIRNGKCVDKHGKYFSSFLNLFKREPTT